VATMTTTQSGGAHEKTNYYLNVITKLKNAKFYFVKMSDFSQPVGWVVFQLINFILFYYFVTSAETKRSGGKKKSRVFTIQINFLFDLFAYKR
jgi:hypothetical protein